MRTRITCGIRRIELWEDCWARYWIGGGDIQHVSPAFRLIRGLFRRRIFHWGRIFLARTYRDGFRNLDGVLEAQIEGEGST